MKDRSHSHSEALLASLFKSYTGSNFALRLWDGSSWIFRPTEPVAFTFVLSSPRVLEALLLHPDEITLGEAFVRKELEVEGDLLCVFDVTEYLFTQKPDATHRALRLLLRSWHSLRLTLRHGRRHSQSRDKASISLHYDQPVEFYRPWLGPTLAYSCAYFRTPNDTLHDAQMQKLDLICRKLRLQPGENFLDMGCGWGSLVLHAARHFGVKAHGITISRIQHEVARKRIREAGLEGQCTVELRDYRTCGELEGLFDKIASVGMYEHVGLPNLPAYFRIVHRLLKPGGAFLNHGIARARWSAPRRDSFIERYVFPDGRLVTVTEAVTCAEQAGFEMRDGENLREHYTITLSRWVQGLHQHKDQLLNLVPESTWRTWLLYTAGCSAAFRRGDIAVHQLLLSRLDRGQAKIPLTRGDWYAAEPAAAVAIRGAKSEESDHWPLSSGL